MEYFILLTWIPHTNIDTITLDYVNSFKIACITSQMKHVLELHISKILSLNLK